MGPEGHHDYGVIPYSSHRSVWRSREVTDHAGSKFSSRTMKLSDFCEGFFIMTPFLVGSTGSNRESRIGILVNF